MKARARADGDGWILNGAKAWITNGGKSSWYTAVAVTDPDKGAIGISAFIVHIDDEGFPSAPRSASSVSTVRRPPSCISRTVAFRGIGSSASRARDSRQRWPPWTTPAR